MSIALDKPSTFMPSDVDDAHIFSEFMDPITLDIMEDPVIDECGHTFNRGTLLAEQRRQGGKNQIVCPLNGKTYVYINQLRENRGLKNLIGSVQRLGGKTPQDLLFKTSLQFETQSAALKRSDRYIEALLLQNAELLAQNRKVIDHNAELTKKIETVNTKLDKLSELVTTQNENHQLFSTKTKVLQKQINNLLSITFWDRAVSILPCSSGQSEWMNQGIDPSELTTLEIKPKDVEELEAQTK